MSVLCQFHISSMAALGQFYVSCMSVVMPQAPPPSVHSGVDPIRISIRVFTLVLLSVVASAAVRIAARARAAPAAEARPHAPRRACTHAAT